MLNDPAMIKKPPQKTPWIKICGLTDPENALECAKIGADAIGLVFFKKSPRNVSIQRAAKISTALPDHILTIGVFVDESYDGIMEKVNRCALKGVQLHGNETPALVDRLLEKKLLVIKALFATKEPFLTQASRYKNTSFFLVEYGKGTLPGGNAESWNYEITLQLNTKTPLILAGGLHPGNICQAIKSARPAGVDVSSGVEKSYGIKDLHKVESFITRVKSK
ncbi:MAG TPA: phosphoribosylanthranilate isomerase [Desulfobacterales bacterium]|nr:phosphoribosylanthranilate isomerase [Deltaproteobacteria bacterium]HGY11513.1 phosphoribosylanthranilate isomerase [Desulfobacterales bacterium]